MGFINGGIGLGVTVNCQLSSSYPAVLVALIVIIWGLPLTVGLGHDTTPVLEFIVIPLGPFSRDHVTGNVPCDREGVGAV